MNADDAYAEYRECLQALRGLNPDLGAGAIDRLYSLATQAGGAHLPEVARFAEELIEHYTQSPPKRISEILLREYFTHIDRAAFQLSEGKDPAQATATGATNPREHSVALVPREFVDPLAWCRILNRADIPRPLVKAVEACRRRNELLTSVVEYVLISMQCMDMEQADAWQTRYLEQRRGRLDPDVVRDFLTAWLRRDSLPRSHLTWAETWSADDGLRQQWPYVVRRADKLLCRHALKRWQAESRPQNSSLAHLHLLVKQDHVEEERLLRWLKGALVDVGESILRFFSLSAVKVEGAEARLQQSTAVMREIRRIEALFTPVMLTADLILAVPDGPYQFATAFFGLVGQGRRQWEARLMNLAQKAVLRAFLDDLRLRRPSLETIRKLTFGDPAAFRQVQAQLDLVSGRFDSMRQRDTVVAYLAVYYASYREPKLLAAEISRRYRTLMRLMHEDNLARILIKPHFAQIMDSGLLPELAALAAEARRFLSRRRSLDMDLEDLVAAEMEFEQGIRQRRLRMLHTLLG